MLYYAPNSPSWGTKWPKMDSARIELPGLVSTQLPERGSANDGTAVLDLAIAAPSPSCWPVAERFVSDYLPLGLGIPFPARKLQSVGTSSLPPLSNRPSLRCITYSFIISCAAHCSGPRWNFPTLSTAYTTFACDELIRYIAARVPDSENSSPGILPVPAGVSLWMIYQHIL